MSDVQPNDPNAICVAVISDVLEVPVSTEVPPHRPKGRFVQVSRTGGTETPFLSLPIMTLLCWGSSDADAYGLAVDVGHALTAAAEEHAYLSASETQMISRDQWSADGTARYMVQVKLTINK